jgi:hypothetical protein
VPPAIVPKSMVSVPLPIAVFALAWPAATTDCACASWLMLMLYAPADAVAPAVPERTSAAPVVAFTPWKKAGSPSFLAAVCSVVSALCSCP